MQKRYTVWGEDYDVEGGAASRELGHAPSSAGVNAAHHGTVLSNGRFPQTERSAAGPDLASVAS